MTNRTKNNTRLVVVAIVAIAAMLSVALTAAIGKSQSAFAQVQNQQNTSPLDQKGNIVDKAATDQDQECKTAGGTSSTTTVAGTTSGISGSCTATSSNTVTESGGDLNEKKSERQAVIQTKPIVVCRAQKNSTTTSTYFLYVNFPFTVAATILSTI